MAVEIGQHFFKRVGLRRGAGKAIQNGTSFTVRLGDAVIDHGDGHIVRDKFALIHKGFGEFSEIGLIFNVLAKQVSGGDVRKFRRFGQDFGLRSFTDTGRAKQNDIGRHKISCLTQLADTRSES